VRGPAQGAQSGNQAALIVALVGGQGAPARPGGFFVVDLDSPALAGWTPENLLDAMVFGADPSVVKATAVGGRWVYRRP
jgi:hypothetical protein